MTKDKMLVGVLRAGRRGGPVSYYSRHAIDKQIHYLSSRRYYWLSSRIYPFSRTCISVQVQQHPEPNV